MLIWLFPFFDTVIVERIWSRLLIILCTRRLFSLLFFSFLFFLGFGSCLLLCLSSLSSSFLLCFGSFLRSLDGFLLSKIVLAFLLDSLPTGSRVVYFPASLWEYVVQFFTVLHWFLLSHFSTCLSPHPTQIVLFFLTPTDPSAPNSWPQHPYFSFSIFEAFAVSHLLRVESFDNRGRAVSSLCHIPRVSFWVRLSMPPIEYWDLEDQEAN